MHISHTKSFNIPLSIALAKLPHRINVYEICLSTTNYRIFNMQDFRYCLWTSILDCFGQLVSLLYKVYKVYKQPTRPYSTMSVLIGSIEDQIIWNLLSQVTLISIDTKCLFDENR